MRDVNAYASHTCEMTHSHASHMCHTHESWMRDEPCHAHESCHTHDWRVCPLDPFVYAYVMHLHEWLKICMCDAFIYVWRIHICVTHSYMCDAFIYVWRIHICVTHSNMFDAFIYVTHKSWCMTHSCMWLIHVCEMSHVWVGCLVSHMGWLQLLGSIKLCVSFAKEPYKRDDILQKRPIISSILLTVATPYMDELHIWMSHVSWFMCHIYQCVTHIWMSHAYEWVTYAYMSELDAFWTAIS